MTKIGILGGSFNPIHTGHMRMAVEARETVGLDRVLLMPAGEPPHKPSEGMLPFAHRLRLVEMAVHGVAGLSASGFEGARPGPSYTVDTLAALREKMPNDELYFIMGSESFMALPGWHRGLEVPHLCSLAVVLRRGTDFEALASFAEANWPGTVRLGPDRLLFASGTSLTAVVMPTLDVSSTDIRRRWRERRCLAMLVPAAAEDILERGGSAYEQAWGQRTEI
ncbi:MAG: nicotinate (nicotinamide) nucleotide adenylyltransferase [Proteobacteria bacterium]|nr:nicotinate (nicotinamide) nucleotide adenylyltransferase [Pseudomonadota bacterium]MBU1595508.1 nicotinate (nicotinamide) nucleotide adenylyltransferase [Pseudomonadota bacterium]